MGKISRKTCKGGSDVQANTQTAAGGHPDSYNQLAYGIGLDNEDYRPDLSIINNDVNDATKSSQQAVEHASRSVSNLSRRKDSTTINVKPRKSVSKRVFNSPIAQVTQSPLGSMHGSHKSIRSHCTVKDSEKGSQRLIQKGSTSKSTSLINEGQKMHPTVAPTNLLPAMNAAFDAVRTGQVNFNEMDFMPRFYLATEFQSEPLTIQPDSSNQNFYWLKLDGSDVYLARARYHGDGTTGVKIHNKPLQDTHAKVELEEIGTGCDTSPVLVPTDEVTTLGESMKTFIAWPLDRMSFDNQV
ncbi:hypothetical protein ACFE04_010034 [Oxalis oulophora]